MTVFYNGECGFCAVCMAVLLYWDRTQRLYPLAIQDRRAQLLLASIPEEERLESAHVRTPEGQVLSGADGAPALFRQLPGGRPLAAVTAGTMPLARLGYRLLTRVRPVIGSVLPAAWRSWAVGLITDRRRGMTPPTALL